MAGGLLAVRSSSAITLRRLHYHLRRVYHGTPVFGH
jgi:hypothetical protein